MNIVNKPDRFTKLNGPNMNFTIKMQVLVHTEMLIALFP